MDTEKLLDLVKRYNENKDFLANEETIKMALVVPLIRYLGYDPRNPREVRLEYRADFVQGDGKKHPDSMDFAIFDGSAIRPLMVIETKPLGTNLRSRSNQLARYIAQMAELHFGIISDGCHYLFFGDLDSPNQMDREPFFEFSLDDANSDWAKIAAFLSKFSRDSFNAETLVTDAENSRYRQAMVERLTTVLRDPDQNSSFMKWLTKDLYKGLRTSAVMDRLRKVARESIEPALLRVIGDDFLEKLKARIHQLGGESDDEGPEAGIPEAQSSAKPKKKGPKAEIETTQEQLEFFHSVREMCVQHGAPPEDILCHNTVFWFSVSYRRPKRWFVRFRHQSKEAKASRDSRLA